MAWYSGHHLGQSVQILVLLLILMLCSGRPHRRSRYDSWCVRALLAHICGCHCLRLMLLLHLFFECGRQTLLLRLHGRRDRRDGSEHHLVRVV